MKKIIFATLFASSFLNLYAQGIYQQKRPSGNMVNCQDHKDLADPKVTYTFCTIDDKERGEVWRFINARKMNETGIEVALERPECVKTFNTCLAYHLVCSRFTVDEICATTEACDYSNTKCASPYKGVNLEALRKQNIMDYDKLKAEFMKSNNRDPMDVKAGSIDALKKRIEKNKKAKENEKK